MKNYKYLLLCFMIGILSSCEKEVDHVDTVNLGANAVLKDTEISLFDVDQNLKIDLLTNGATFNKIEVIKQELVKDNGKMSKKGKQLYKKTEKKVGDATIKGKEAFFNSSILTPFIFKNGEIKKETDVINGFTFKVAKDEKNEETSGAFNLFLKSLLSSGKELNNLYSIIVAKVITLKSGVNQVKYNDTLSQKIFFNTATKYAKIDKITLSWKKGKLGTYAEDKSIDFDAKNNKLNNKENLDSINLKKLDYIKKYHLKIGDTLYYKFTAKSKSLIDTLVTSVAIVPQTMGSVNKASLSAKNKEFNLKTKDNKKSEIEYLSPTGIQVTAGTKLSFVKVALPTGVKADDYFSEGNLSTAKPTFRAGTAMTSINNVVKNTILLYKITRKDKDGKDVVFYGLIKIGDILNTGTTNEVVNFEYKEGVLVGN